MGYWGGYYPRYVSVAEKKAKAAKKLKQLSRGGASHGTKILNGMQTTAIESAGGGVMCVMEQCWIFRWIQGKLI